MNEQPHLVLLDDDYCFACGSRNPLGLHLRFTVSGDEVVAQFTPGPHLQGFAGLLHGGIAATVLDDVMNNLVARMRGRMVVSGSLEVRFLKPVQLGPALECRARLVQERGRFFRAEAELRVRGENEVLVAGNCLMVEVGEEPPVAD